jgi:hypothetical protein
MSKINSICHAAKECVKSLLLGNEESFFRLSKKIIFVQIFDIWQKKNQILFLEPFRLPLTPTPSFFRHVPNMGINSLDSNSDENTLLRTTFLFHFYGCQLKVFFPLKKTTLKFFIYYLRFPCL